MIEIFAHRAIYQNKQNTIKGIENNLKQGFNLEIDIRKNNHGIYLAHDAQNNGELFENACKIIQNYSKKIAIHLKEDIEVKEIIDLVSKYNVKDNCFIFSTLKNKIKSENINIAKYCTNKKDFIDSKIFWCDESKEKWYDRNLFLENNKQKKIIIAMSKELLSESNFEEIKFGWSRLLELNVDGICTDYPDELKKFLDGNQK